MEQIILARNKQLQKQWEAKQQYLTDIFVARYKRKPEHLFENIEFLRREAGLDIRVVGGSAYFLNQYPWQGTKKHYVIFQNPKARTKELQFWKPLQIILGAENPQLWALVKTDRGSINYPHIHLLIYR